MAHIQRVGPNTNCELAVKNHKEDERKDLEQEAANRDVDIKLSLQTQGRHLVRLIDTLKEFKRDWVLRKL